MAYSKRMDITIGNELPSLFEMLQKGVLENELDYSRALVAYRSFIRSLNKGINPKISAYRNKLSEMISSYEDKFWSDINLVTDNQVQESDHLDLIAERERVFIENRKLIIKKALKENKINQQELGQILGHNKSYMSELLNGIHSFSLKDIKALNLILGIKLEEMIFLI